VGDAGVVLTLFRGGAPERFYLRDGASVDAMVRGALDELLGWLGQAPRLDLCAVDLTEPVSHPAAGIVGNGVAPDIAAHRLALVMQLLRVEQSLLARAMEPQRRVGEREDDHAALTALTSARYRWAWHVASAIETWQAAHAIAAEKRKGPTARTRPSDVRAKLVHFARDLDDAQRQLGALMAPLRERYARIRAQAEVARG
jgi:hypothetical protein